LKLTKLQVLLAALGGLAAAFHLWYGGRMPVLGPTSLYFFSAGALFLVGSVLVLAKGKGVLFFVGAGGLMALAAIDNGLLYYTRTYGFGVLASVMRGPPVSGFPSHGNGTFPTRPFNGTAGFRPPPGGFGHGGSGWYSSLNPPGPLEFLVLQLVVIVAAAAAIFLVWRSPLRSAGQEAGSTAPEPPRNPTSG